MDHYVKEETSIDVKREVATRSLLKNSFMWMFLGLTITAIVSALCLSSTSLMLLLRQNPLILIVVFVIEIVVVMYFASKITSLKTQTAISLFLLYSALNGFTLSVLLFMYTKESIFQTFIISACLFGGMALYGQFTKKDLSSMGSFLVMGIWGIILVSVVNFFFQSSLLAVIISFAAVIIFMGLTAYDVQKIKDMARQADAFDQVTYVRISIFGALKLYLDFINIFIHLLFLLGRRR